jgi:type IV secretory pathway component VirB8
MLISLCMLSMEYVRIEVAIVRQINIMLKFDYTNKQNKEGPYVLHYNRPKNGMGYQVTHYKLKRSQCCNNLNWL